MPLSLRYVARSDVGLVREGNEDSGYAGPRLLVVADGMGGHAAGEVASAATVEELVRLESSPSAARPAEEVRDALAGAVHGANERIRELVQEDPRREGMGTTVTALMWAEERLVLAHVGDSRAYLLRDGDLEQVTHDHTFVQSLVDEGRITEDEAGVHPARSLLLRALTGTGDVEPDVLVLDARAGDRLLVCSDGLSGVVSAATMAEVLGGRPDLDEAADSLVDLALKAGAPDNVTCVVADVVEVDEDPGAGAEQAAAATFLVGAAGGHHLTTRDTGQLDRVAPVAASGEDSERPFTDDDDPESMRYAPRPPRRFVWLRRIALLALAGVLVWGGLQLADRWIRDQYFVGDEEGSVAVYRGLGQQVGPLALSELYASAPGLPVAALPGIYQEQVADTIAADDLPDAERIVDRLRREACAIHPPQLPPAASPAPVPTTTATPEPGTSPEPTPAPAATTPAPQGPTRPTATPTPGFPGLECDEVAG